MLEHLVQGHLGGYYISSGELEFIEQYCEQCGDSDEILTSWDEYEEDARLNALLRYFMQDVLNDRKDIDRKVEEYVSYSVEPQDIVPSMLDNISYNLEDVFSIVSSLFENHEISEEEFNKIIQIAHFEEDRQLKMVKHFAKSMFTKDKDGTVKLLKLSK